MGSGGLNPNGVWFRATLYLVGLLMLSLLAFRLPYFGNAYKQITAEVCTLLATREHFAASLPTRVA
jgi:hypothetical protein